MPHDFRPGQRWISETEPELGLGSVLRVNSRTVFISFAASDETREYARDTAPLRRVRFRIGDAVKSENGGTLTVQAILERNGLIFYRGDRGEICETELSAAISFNKPEERLFAGQLDAPDLFDLRLAALHHQHRRRKSKVRGFVGGRIQLIPHQLYIASEVARRLLPRVLLADEVGLGKTIEACLILHRLILTGRVQRALIVVPDSLVHQWFVELLRRFNLWFNIFNPERCEAIEATNPEANPFLDDQLVLCSLSLFTSDERRLQQAIAAGWDVLVVDEAHHLGWSTETVSLEYSVVESLAGKTPGLLLLTATPEQLGVASHFARLRLLDPDRFYDLSEFVREAEHYRDVAQTAEKLLGGRALESNDIEMIAGILSQSIEEVGSILEQAGVGSRVRDQLIEGLLDRHGTGRVMFRNTRATIAGFPRRLARLHLLEGSGDGAAAFEALAEEFAADSDPKAAAEFQPEYSNDARIAWLVSLLRSLPQEKVLLICRTQRKVEAIESALRERLNVKMGMFHEGLPLVQRDRQAAWFAEEDGARLLICSEIGSEGRNFQFAHHLVLFDLPLDPELLEQRIGRLDRIGQTSAIQVHVPYVRDSPQEVLARWYHEALNSFEKNLHGARELLERFGPRVRDLAQDFHETADTAHGDLKHLLEETAAARDEIAKRLEQGRDRLLELNSFRPVVAAALVDEISRQDADVALDAFMVAVLDHYSIHVEEIRPRTYHLGSAGVFADSFPGLPTEGLTVTGDRQRALAREDVSFLTWDHPLVTGALDLLLGSEKGNCSFARWPDPKKAGLYVEAVYLLECVAPPPLHVDRFLAPTPLRVLLDHLGADVSASIGPGWADQLKRGDAYALLDQPGFREDLLPTLLEKARTIAERMAPDIVAQSRREMAGQLDEEIRRLQELQKVNRSVRAEEIDLLLQQRRLLDEHLAGARLRLDAIRIIQRGLP